MEQRIITLLTDFGEEDWFVGSMKGVIASLCPSSRTVDITHRISPGDISGGGLILRCAYHYFPPGTVHLAVVDPGVGGERSVLVAEGEGYIFVAPDNGLLSRVWVELEEKRAFRAERRELFLDPVSDTFHGRDIFAPLAARLAGGLDPSEVGPFCPDPVLVSTPGVRKTGETTWEVEIIGTDHFGNCLTSLKIDSPPFSLTNLEGLEIRPANDSYFLPLVGAYCEVKKGAPCLIRGSCGYLEFSLNGENASDFFGLRAGDRCPIRPVPAGEGDRS